MSVDEGYVGFMLGIDQMKKRLAEKDKEIERLKVHCNALYDSLFVLQKFFEHGANDTELSKKAQEANLTMVETIVKVLVTARKHGIDGTICSACKHQDCQNCDLDVILKIQETANAPDTNGVISKKI